MYSSVAQLVEQTAVNRLVAGSSPVGGAFYKNTKFFYIYVVDRYIYIWKGCFYELWKDI